MPENSISSTTVKAISAGVMSTDPKPPMRAICFISAASGKKANLRRFTACSKPIPGFTYHDSDELNGNSVRMAAAWNGQTDLSKLEGRPIRLHLLMRSAKLYAFQFLP